MGISTLLNIVRRLKDTPRTGWLKAGIENPESVAEHSYEVALLASIIADELNLDHSKLVRAALVHDLGESETGDIPFKNDEQAAAEEEALGKILEAVPEVKSKYIEPLTEKEQAVIQFADNLSMLRQAEAYGVSEIQETAQKNLDQITERFPELSKFWPEAE